MNLLTRQKLTHIENKLMVTKWKEGGINQEFGINRYTPLYTKQINNKDLLYNTGNYIQYLLIPYNGKESEKAYLCMYVCITEITLLYT